MRTGGFGVMLVGVTVLLMMLVGTPGAFRPVAQTAYFRQDRSCVYLSQVILDPQEPRRKAYSCSPYSR